MQLCKTHERLVLLEIENHPDVSEYLLQLSGSFDSYHIPANKLVCFKSDYELQRLKNSLINNGEKLLSTDLDLEELIQLNDNDLFDFAAKCGNAQELLLSVFHRRSFMSPPKDAPYFCMIRLPPQCKFRVSA